MRIGVPKETRVREYRVGKVTHPEVAGALGFSFADPRPPLAA